jgi:glycosyltransferase involved in cell wall biosynthesis
MNSTKHILVNALSMGSGGGFTVGRELLRNLAIVRPDWQITCALIEAHPLHEQMRDVSLSANARLFWAPSATIARGRRVNWERRELTRWAAQHSVDAVVQLNGMAVRGMRPPTVCHMQDPWPYRAEAWEGIKDRVLAFVKRRVHRQTLKNAAAFTWTSDYLRKLICGNHNIWPQISEVVYNGVPQPWIERAAGQLPDWDSRPNELITVSTVGPYKRHSLVIQALPGLTKQPGLKDLTYRIVGDCGPVLHEELLKMATRLGVADRVRFEGRVSDEDLAGFYSRAKCFVMMSVCESFGIPAIEAMSFGTPVVTADCCAMPEVCGDAAELSPVDDLGGLVQRISRVLLDPAHAHELRLRGARRAARFSWSRAVEQLARILERIGSSTTRPRMAATSDP